MLCSTAGTLYLVPFMLFPPIHFQFTTQNLFPGPIFNVPSGFLLTPLFISFNFVVLEIFRCTTQLPIVRMPISFIHSSVYSLWNTAYEGCSMNMSAGSCCRIICSGKLHMCYCILISLNHIFSFYLVFA